MSELDRDRLRALIRERQTSARAISLKISNDQNQDLVRDILSGKSRNPRTDTLARIAAELGVEASELIKRDRSGSVHVSNSQLKPQFLPVRYRVQAGAWYEVESEEPPEQAVLAVLPDPRYASFPQWLEKVVGDSANRRIPEGFYVHVVDAIEMGYAPADGDWVVVVRTRDQGAIAERTVKQVNFTEDGRVLLCPRSTNPRWQDPVDFTAGLRDGEEGVEVRIAGKVIGAIDPNF